MRKHILLFLLVMILAGCSNPKPEEPSSESVPVLTETMPAPEMTAPPETETTAPLEPAIEMTEREKTSLLKLAMAERGDCGCVECIALVMRTVLNRWETGHFGSSIRDVIFAKGQFAPVSDGSYYAAEPNQLCQEALEMVIHGWDESQGALFYEWCEGESWHSQNLNLLFQHCDIRFYN